MTREENPFTEPFLDRAAGHVSAKFTLREDTKELGHVAFDGAEECQPARRDHFELVLLDDFDHLATNNLRSYE
jgi:hypothetical protein